MEYSVLFYKLAATGVPSGRLMFCTMPDTSVNSVGIEAGSRIWRDE